MVHVGVTVGMSVKWVHSFMVGTRISSGISGHQIQQTFAVSHVNGECSSCSRPNVMKPDSALERQGASAPRQAQGIFPARLAGVAVVAASLAGHQGVPAPAPASNCATSRPATQHQAAAFKPPTPHSSTPLLQAPAAAPTAKQQQQQQQAAPLAGGPAVLSYRWDSHPFHGISPADALDPDSGHPLMFAQFNVKVTL